MPRIRNDFYDMIMRTPIWGHPVTFAEREPIFEIEYLTDPLNETTTSQPVINCNLKVGEKYRIKKYDVIPPFWNEHTMPKYMGMEVTILEIYPVWSDGSLRIHIKEDQQDVGGWTWRIEDFEPLVKLIPKLVVRDNGHDYDMTEEQKDGYLDVIYKHSKPCRKCIENRRK